MSVPPRYTPYVPRARRQRPFNTDSAADHLDNAPCRDPRPERLLAYASLHDAASNSFAKLPAAVLHLLANSRGISSARALRALDEELFGCLLAGSAIAAGLQELAQGSPGQQVR